MTNYVLTGHIERAPKLAQEQERLYLAYYLRMALGEKKSGNDIRQDQAIRRPEGAADDLWQAGSD